MTTLNELLEGINNPSNKKRVIVVLHHNKVQSQAGSLSTEGVRAALKQARVAGATRINVCDVLAKCGGLVDSQKDENGQHVWELTKSGDSYAREILGEAAVSEEIHRMKVLTSLVSAVKDGQVREYVEEALVCLGVGALRAAVVFLWTGAMCELHRVLLQVELPELNRVLTLHDPKSRVIKTLDDFSYVRDSNAILAAQGLGLIDKGQRQALEEGLQLRNRCGHPTQYRPGANKVAAFAEDIASVLFSERGNSRAA